MISLSQTGSDIFSFFPHEEVFDLKKYEIRISDKTLNEYAIKLKPYYKYLFAPTYGKPMLLSEFMRHLHVVNLNNDDMPDIIYYGYSGAESDCTELFLNEGVGFRKIFSNYGFLERLEFNNASKLSSFTIKYLGCCAEYTETQTRYRIMEGAKVSREFKRIIVTNTEKPTSRLNKPIRFKTLNDSYTLRSSTKIDNLPGSINGDPRRGNVVSVYPKNAYGTAWAQKTDSTGRIWWFVEMDPISGQKENIAIDYNRIPSRTVGWLSSRYVEKIEQ
jgi:hypothetical protein